MAPLFENLFQERSAASTNRSEASLLLDLRVQRLTVATLRGFHATEKIRSPLLSH